jgi:hypothetical protein
MSSQRACKTLAAEQCACCVFLQNLHPVGGQLDANFIQPDANFVENVENLFICFSAHGNNIFYITLQFIFQCVHFFEKKKNNFLNLNL